MGLVQHGPTLVSFALRASSSRMGSPALSAHRSSFAWLTVLVAVLAALGVLNTALMATHEWVHDQGVSKAAGMTPRQTITMVICWVTPPPSSPRPSPCPPG